MDNVSPIKAIKSAALLAVVEFASRVEKNRFVIRMLAVDIRPYNPANRRCWRGDLIREKSGSSDSAAEI